MIGGRRSAGGNLFEILAASAVRLSFRLSGSNSTRRVLIVRGKNERPRQPRELRARATRRTLVRGQFADDNVDFRFLSASIRRVYTLFRKQKPPTFAVTTR